MPMDSLMAVSLLTPSSSRILPLPAWVGRGRGVEVCWRRETQAWSRCSVSRHVEFSLVRKWADGLFAPLVYTKSVTFWPLGFYDLVYTATRSFISSLHPYFPSPGFLWFNCTLLAIYPLVLPFDYLCPDPSALMVFFSLLKFTV